MYPWQSRLPPETGETAFTTMVREHLAPELDVFEPGCGHGADAVLFAPRVRSYRAYDAVEAYVVIAREAARSRGVRNVEFVVADTSPKRNEGRVLLPAEPGSIDLFVSRRGPTHWILDVPRVARPGAVLLQLNPMGGERLAWEDELPDGLRLPHGPEEMEDRIADLLQRAGLNFDGRWRFDVAEHLPDPEQLYLMATWMVDSPPAYANCRQELERLFRRHATEQGLEARQRRLLWKAVVPSTARTRA